MPKAKEVSLCVLIRLADIDPPVYRRVVIPGEIDLYQLHVVIQVAMGWMDSHLHMFVKNGRILSLPSGEDDWDGFRDEELDERQFLVKDMLQQGKRGKLLYVCDFGDNWEHEIILEKTVPVPSPGAMLIDGARACPPEDVGGSPGYGYFLEAIGDPKHPEHAEMLEWTGGRFDPEAFDAEMCEAELRSLKFKRRKRGKNFLAELE
jgi:hypothetical protein